MAQDTLLGFPAHTLPYRRGEFTTLSTASFCPEVRLLAVFLQPGYPFSDGHSVFKVLSIDELP